MNTISLIAERKSKKDAVDLGTELNEKYHESEVVRIDVAPITTDLVKLRKRLGLSQQSFADRYGLSAQNIRNWEQGIRSPDRAAMLYIALIDHYPEEAAKVASLQINKK